MMLISETLVNIINHCPCGKPSESCVVAGIRSYDRKQQIRHILSLTIEEKVALIKEHKYCKTVRENNNEVEILNFNEFQDFI